ncbi:hypothetical protein [uncultured Clostridium sp.]|uniref:hypothetical protein n=1 Tax=uncultured Clostridium sp. TaxID=59620 RepID=UPI0025E6A480|nr:hypothetical protein [uncultured Clostridium sp.]
MKIAVIQASSQKDKNSIIYDTLIKVVKYKEHEVINRRNVFDYVMKYGQDIELMKLLQEY